MEEQSLEKNVFEPKNKKRKNGEKQEKVKKKHKKKSFYFDLNEMRVKMIILYTDT